ARSVAAAACRLGAGKPVTGLSARALLLAEGVTPTMLPNKVKLATVLLVALCALGTGLGVLARPAPEPAAPARDAQRPATTPQTPAKPEDKTIEVKGRVLGPDGRPVAGAKVYVSSYTEQDRREPDVRATTGPDGRFRFSTRQSAVDHGETVVAVADGYGPDWAELGTLKDGRLPELRLVKDDVPLSGRVLDLEARPVRDAT